ncbi:hypothetical protein GCM10023187_00380 [Nibrella viscosa]|uniref:Lipocalin-like domain-containing protein n=1 Tax=Nibrella viscosa TaxID=1084524 RepID=A0ABP8JQD5_9BACT
MKPTSLGSAIYSLLLFALTFWACENPPFPTVTSDTALRDRLKGIWVPVSLTMKYQVGATPNPRDTLVTVTPNTAPLLVAGRANPIMPFTDTLYLAAATARSDTFWLANRGIRQQGNFSAAKVNDAGQEAILLRFGRPTYTRGQVTRWNYDFVFHGTVAPNAANAPVYTPASYPNYAPTIVSLTDQQMVLMFSTTGTINVPVVPLTAANRDVNAAWAGRPIVFTATYAKR